MSDTTAPKPKRTAPEISTHVQSHFLKTARDAKTLMSFQGPDLHELGIVVRWDSFTIVIEPVSTVRHEILIFKQALTFIEPVLDPVPGDAEAAEVEQRR